MIFMAWPNERVLKICHASTTMRIETECAPMAGGAPQPLDGERRGVALADVLVAENAEELHQPVAVSGR
jgi:hypothetical protein